MWYLAHCCVIFSCYLGGEIYICWATNCVVPDSEIYQSNIYVFRNKTRKEMSSCSFYRTILWQRLTVNPFYGDLIMKFDFDFNRNDHLRSFLETRKKKHRSKECYINQIYLQAISRDSCHLPAGKLKLRLYLLRMRARSGR